MYIGEDGRLDEVAFFAVTRATDFELCTFLFPVLNVAVSRYQPDIFFV